MFPLMMYNGYTKVCFLPTFRQWKLLMCALSQRCMDHSQIGPFSIYMLCDAHHVPDNGQITDHFTGPQGALHCIRNSSIFMKINFILLAVRIN